MKREATRSIGEAIAAYVQESNLQEGLLQARIFMTWDKITIGSVSLGACTSHHTYKNGVLTCRIRSSVVRSHLQLQAEAIRLRLNDLLKGDYVKQVKLT